MILINTAPLLRAKKVNEDFVEVIKSELPNLPGEEQHKIMKSIELRNRIVRARR